MQDPKYPEAHPWTLKKLEFLKKYLPAFVKATQKATSRHYVDGFAGPGYNRQEDGTLVEGSPLLALQHQFTSFFFVEKGYSSSGISGSATLALAIFTSTEAISTSLWTISCSRFTQERLHCSS
jgi:hypothetical protein